MQIQDTNQVTGGLQNLIIPSYMLNERLTASEVFILAYVNGFSKNGGLYRGTRRHMAKALKISEKATLRSVKSLLDAGYLIEKTESGRSGLVAADRARFINEKKDRLY